MRLLCNFVNVNTIAYRVQYTFTHVHARTPTDILARESAPRVGQVGGQVGEDHHACSARGKLNGEVAGHADILATILTRKSARMSVSVSVSVPWNCSLTDAWDGGVMWFCACVCQSVRAQKKQRLELSTQTLQTVYARIGTVHLKVHAGCLACVDPEVKKSKVNQSIQFILR